ncbi:hypothetical protein SAMN05444143_103231 [Flavobacterium succinicans]|uniref:Uncharacterized protein n=1 Tax=Flavobacterium succinicans TaxID=29536 RepID=A0A1I4UMS3_9FLAO|nr:hypothetical protein [Flavobacterium succinicans]SFM90003.1 hypothetical protein SAMN05444143_103231 [Flavobacterium succinicans]
MKADIEKLLNEIANDRHGLSDLVLHYGNPAEIEMEDWWDAPIEVLQNNLRQNVKPEDKKGLILLAMGVGAIKNDESKVSEY